MTTELDNSQFHGSFQSWKCLPIPKNPFDYSKFLNDSKPALRSRLKEKLGELKALKININYLGYFYFAIDGKTNEPSTSSVKNFHSQTREVLNDQDILKLSTCVSMK